MTGYNRLRQLRRAKGLTLSELAARVAETDSRIDSKLISKLEHGQRSLSEERASILANALGVEPGDFFENADRKD